MIKVTSHPSTVRYGQLDMERLTYSIVEGGEKRKELIYRTSARDPHVTYIVTRGN